MVAAMDNETVTLGQYPADLVAELARLHAAGLETATIALQVMPFGHRAVLEATDAVERDSHHQVWQFTDSGIETLAKCHEQHDPVGPELSSALAGLSAAVAAVSD